MERVKTLGRRISQVAARFPGTQVTELVRPLMESQESCAFHDKAALIYKLPCYLAEAVILKLPKLRSLFFEAHLDKS